MNYVVGVDIGGTFTDCVVVDEGGKVTIGKSLSTPADFSQGALNAAGDAAQNIGLKNADELLGATRLFFHACTVGDNTLITRAGAKTGLILTKGFGDTLHMMRGKIAEALTENEIAHRSALDKPEPFVPRKMVEEVPERIDYKGQELIRLDVHAAQRTIHRLVSKGAESIAVCFLWSIMNDSHEQQLAEMIKKNYPELFFTLSSEVAPYLGEYERSATTVFNAYIGPKISSYLKNLLKMTEVEAASGINRIANSHMSDLIRKATVEKGHDPRNFVLFAFGGAAPVHASRYAAELGIRQVVVPLTASVHGATGLISSDVVYEYGKSDHVVVPVETTRVNENFSGLLARALGDLSAAGFDESAVLANRSVDMRYRYQVHELNVPFPAGTTALTAEAMEGLYALFDDLYEKAFGQGSGYREAGKEILTFRLTATGSLKKPDIKAERVERSDGAHALKGRRDVYFEEERKFVPTAVYDFTRMQPGVEFDGPAIIETPVTTIVVNPNDRAVMDEHFNIRIHLGA